MNMLPNVKKWLSLAVALALLCASVNFARAPVAYAEGKIVYLPFVVKDFPWKSPFGVETYTGNMAASALQVRASALGTKYLRQNSVSWRAVQLTQGGTYNWSALARFEADAVGASAAGLQVTAIVNDSPKWAVVDAVDINGKPIVTSCAAIRTDRFADFAAYMTALVNRYKVAPYNVHHWELGNEIDVDPALVEIDNPFGCWGK